MRSFRIASLVGLFCCLPASARADWFFTPFLGLKFGGATNLVDPELGAGNTKWTLGGQATLLGDGMLGVEVDFGVSPRFFEQENTSGLTARSNVTTLMGNVIVVAPAGLVRDSLRPFAVGGLGLMHVRIKDVIDLFGVNSNLLGLTVGGGAIGALTTFTSLRFELRYFRNVTDDKDVVVFGNNMRLSFWRGTVGLAIRY